MATYFFIELWHSTLLPLLSVFLPSGLVPANTLLPFVLPPAMPLLERAHQQLHDIGAAYSAVPYDLIVAGKALATSAIVRGVPVVRRHWLLSFWASFLLAYGDYSLPSLVLQTDFVWLKKDIILVTFAICWWLITYCPGDIGYKAFSFKPIKVACKAASGLARTNVILSMVDAAVKHFGPHLIVAPLFIGTLSGCGGRLIYGAVLFAVAPSACSHPELLYPSWYSHSAFLVSIVYTLAVHWMAVCSRDAAYGAIATFMVAHSAWEAVSDSHLDPSAPLFSLFHSVLRIPPPPAILHSSHDAPPAHSKPRESDTSAPASDSTDKQSPGTKTVSSSQPLGQDPSLANGGTDGEGKASRGEQKAFRRPRSKKA